MVAARMALEMALEMALVECLHAYDHPHTEGWTENDGFRLESTNLREPELVLEV